MSLPATLVRADRALARQLFGSKEDEFVRSTLQEAISEGGHVVAVPHWAVLQRALNEGSCEPEGGIVPLNHCLLGGRQLHAGPEYCISLVRPDLVPHLARELQNITEEQFRQQVQQFGGDEAADFSPLWDELQLVSRFYSDCAEGGHSAVFVAPRT